MKQNLHYVLLLPLLAIYFGFGGDTLVIGGADQAFVLKYTAILESKYTPRWVHNITSYVYTCTQFLHMTMFYLHLEMDFRLVVL